MMHRLKFPAVATLVTAFLVACGGGGDNGSDPKPQTTVVVSPSTRSRVAGETQQFSATVNGVAATAGQVAWSSTNTAVATVDATTGLATAVAAGTTKIRATVGTTTAEADLTVVANTAPTANAGADAEVNRSATVALTGTGVDAQGQTITYKWTQTGGPDVTNGVGYLTGAAPSFTAPSTVTVLRFSLATSDGFLSSAPDEVVVYVLEDAGKSVWVSSTGSDANAGTRASPLRSIKIGLDSAEVKGADLYISEGTGFGGATLRTGVSMYGGFATDWSVRYAISDVAHRSVLAGPGLRGDAVSDLTIDGIAVEAQDEPRAGLGSYGIMLANSQRVTISNDAIAGGNGSAGTSGSAGTNGASGSTAAAATQEIYATAGGSSGGGMGGRGGDASTPAAAGQNGQPPGPLGNPAAGAAGGAAASPPTPGRNGANGANGAAGSIGAAGATLGTFGPNGFVPASGGKGANGNFGGGGGGGGGGGYVYSFPIGYNGGGGGGGAVGGTGGLGGGGSFAIYLYASTEITITGNTLTTRAGGSGGAGGTGGTGGPGGYGGAGYDPSTSNDGREGGAGGMGGRGGDGGRGGGGAGGPSLGIVAVGGSTFTETANTFTLGTSGPGGLPNGLTGVLQAIYTAP